jgi:glycosyltransferase involved in cell wall biosynthesis
LLGAGPLIIKYRRIIAALKITSQITFLGWQDNPYCFLRQADIFLLLSYYEGFPFSLLEALAIGLPIITSDVDFGPREILAGGRYGILIKNTSPKNIQKAIHQALKTKKQLQLRQKRANDFDSSYIFPQYLRIFQKLIQ